MRQIRQSPNRGCFFSGEISMHNFTAIKKILVYLMKAMDSEEADLDEVSAEILGISELRRAAIFQIMTGAGLIEGVNVVRTLDGEVFMEVNNPSITLKGLEYLYGSEFMLNPEDCDGAMSDED